MNYEYLTMEDVKRSESRNLFKVISMFAGCGGSSTGYRLAGGNVIVANEFIEHARSIYNRNYPNTVLIPDDIRNITGKDILETVGLKKGELDILDGSPPCAAFSTAGNMQDSWGIQKKYSNTVQRIDDLFFEFARVLNEIQPKVFVCENTKGLAMKSSSELLGSTNKLCTFIDMDENKTILGELKKCGYNIYTKVLDSSDFGVGQKRERLFIVGVRKDINRKFSFPKSLYEKINSEQVIRKFVFNGCERKINKESQTFKLITKYVKPLTTVQEVVHILVKNNVKGFKQRITRDNWFKPHQTVCQSDWITHSIVDRYESVNESKLIQSFPIDFDILEKQYKRIEVTFEDLEKNKYDFVNEDAGLEGVHLDILKPKKNELFWIDIKDDSLIDNKEELSPNRANEFIGRAVPPLLMKALIEKVYMDILL
jgi:DNA-cytosine methyltransferase